jgi:hypothetical protein
LNVRFALPLMSTVWIVPFLMFFDVTTMVAAVPLAAATAAATTAAMTAFFTGTLFWPRSALPTVDFAPSVRGVRANRAGYLPSFRVGTAL